MVIMEHCGGASGPVWGFAFKTAGAVVVGNPARIVKEEKDDQTKDKTLCTKESC